MHAFAVVMRGKVAVARTGESMAHTDVFRTLTVSNLNKKPRRNESRAGAAHLTVRWGMAVAWIELGCPAEFFLRRREPARTIRRRNKE
jgi:hypothetical protein